MRNELLQRKSESNIESISENEKVPRRDNLNKYTINYSLPSLPKV